MDLNLHQEIAALRRLGTAQLRQRYAQVYGEPTRVGNKPWLVKRIAWRLQALAEGDLTERARRRAAELVNDADLRLSPPRPKPTPPAPQPSLDASAAGGDRRLPPPGTVLTRRYKGQLLQVHVLPDGFAHEGVRYKSLSAVAKAITGSHCNGFLFFRLSTGGNP